MIGLQWALGIGFLATAVVLCIGNASVIVRFVLQKKRGSMIPLLASVVGILGLLTLPAHGATYFWWLPILADPGSGWWLVSLPVFLIRRRRNMGPRSP
jgi:hypothetical protein